MTAVFTTDLGAAAIRAAHADRCHCGAPWAVPVVLQPANEDADPVIVLVCRKCDATKGRRSLDVTG